MQLEVELLRKLLCGPKTDAGGDPFSKFGLGVGQSWKEPRRV